MSPFAVTVVFILTVLFGLLSFAPVLTNPKDMDSLDPASTTKTGSGQ